MMIIVAVAIVIVSQEPRFVVLETEYSSMAECERATAHDPWIICAETPAQ